jgi:hypothetical protein
MVDRMAKEMVLSTPGLSTDTCDGYQVSKKKRPNLVGCSSHVDVVECCVKISLLEIQ